MALSDSGVLFSPRYIMSAIMLWCVAKKGQINSLNRIFFDEMCLRRNDVRCSQASVERSREFKNKLYYLISIYSRRFFDSFVIFFLKSLFFPLVCLFCYISFQHVCFQSWVKRQQTSHITEKHTIKHFPLELMKIANNVNNSSPSSQANMTFVQMNF